MGNPICQIVKASGKLDISSTQKQTVYLNLGELAWAAVNEEREPYLAVILVGGGRFFFFGEEMTRLIELLDRLERITSLPNVDIEGSGVVRAEAVPQVW